jgi:hypothetical protein
VTGTDFPKEPEAGTDFPKEPEAGTDFPKEPEAGYSFPDLFKKSGNEYPASDSFWRLTG